MGQDFEARRPSDGSESHAAQISTQYSTDNRAFANGPRRCCRNSGCGPASMPMQRAASGMSHYRNSTDRNRKKVGAGIISGARPGPARSVRRAGNYLNPIGARFPGIRPVAVFTTSQSECVISVAMRVYVSAVCASTSLPCLSTSLPCWLKYQPR